MSTERPNNVVEELVRDAVEPQRQKGKVPDVNAVHGVVRGIVERMERKQSDRTVRETPVERPEPIKRDMSQLEQEYRRRLQRAGESPLPGKWSVERTPSPVKPKANRVMSLAEERMRKRLRTLRQHPEWAARLKRINPLALNGQLGLDKKKHAEQLVREVIDDSTRVFGPWWKDRPAKIWSLPSIG